MNDQIKQLAEQAGFDLGNGQTYKVENFAELIIKETLQVARAGVEFGNGMEDAVYNYFGVEQ